MIDLFCANQATRNLMNKYYSKFLFISLQFNSKVSNHLPSICKAIRGKCLYVGVSFSRENTFNRCRPSLGIQLINHLIRFDIECSMSRNSFINFGALVETHSGTWIDSPVDTKKIVSCRFRHLNRLKIVRKEY